MANPAWRKGVSGNPAGRPKLPAEIKAGCRRLAMLGLVRIEQMLRDPNTTDENVIRATKLLAAYGYGTPVNTLIAREDEDDSGITVEIVHFADLAEEAKPDNVVAISPPKPKR